MSGGDRAASGCSQMTDPLEQVQEFVFDMQRGCSRIIPTLALDAICRELADARKALAEEKE